ncbi:MAG: PQQ-binding-like beta-propeller repeat protein [Candidatus Aminicenantes bacterium]|nr:PQQ-binding-like beta-propeller repeat protein [Candidatus Aminicenantes bacterium]
MRISLRRIVFVLILIFLLPFLTISIKAKTESLTWPQFRGLNGCGISETTGLPLEFGPDKNVIWKTPLSEGHSSPVLTENHIFVTAVEGESLLTICLNRQDGRIIWQNKAPRPRKEKFDNRNNPASPSPVTDGKSVYVFFPDFGLLAYDITGKELWRFSMEPFDNMYGMGASPILADDKVILVCDQQTNSFIIAVNKKTGEEVWKTERPEAISGHSTPITYNPEGQGTQILVPGSFLLTSYSAETGNKIWWVGGLAFEMKSIPVIQNGILYINGYASHLNQPDNQVKIPLFEDALIQYDKDKNGQLKKDELPDNEPYGYFSFVDREHDGALDTKDWSFFQAALASLNGMLAIRLGGQGDMSANNLVWHYRRSVPQLPSPLLYKNILFMINDGGIVTTFMPGNGEVVAQGRLSQAGSHFYSSLVAADDKVFIISLRGVVTVLKPDGSLNILAQNNLNEQCYATPAIADGKIYLRTVKTLYCFGLKSQ